MNEGSYPINVIELNRGDKSFYFLHAINNDRQTRLLNVLGQIAMILGGKKKFQNFIGRKNFGFRLATEKLE